MSISLQILGPDYTAALLKWVDKENLPTFLGGTSTGTLFEDIGPWSDPAKIASLGMDLEQLRNGPPTHGPRGSSSARVSEETGHKLGHQNGGGAAEVAAAAAPAAVNGESSSTSTYLKRAPSAASDVFHSPSNSISEHGSVGVGGGGWMWE